MIEFSICARPGGGHWWPYVEIRTAGRVYELAYAFEVRSESAALTIAREAVARLEKRTEGSLLSDLNAAFSPLELFMVTRIEN